MENLSKKANWAIGLSSASFLIVVAMIAVWICEAREICVVELDSFIGVIVALLAIIVTIAIGWQIWAAMDLRSNIAKLDIRIKEVEDLKNQFRLQQEKIEQLTLKNKHMTGLTWGNIAVKEEDWPNAFRYFIVSLGASLQLETPINIESIFYGLNIISTNIKSDLKYPAKRHEEIVEANNAIRAMSNFSLIEARYKELYDKIYAKINVDDDQK